MKYSLPLTALLLGPLYLATLTPSLVSGAPSPEPMTKRPAHPFEVDSTTFTIIDERCDGTRKIVLPQPGQMITIDKPFEILYCSPATFRYRTFAIRSYGTNIDKSFEDGGLLIARDFEQVASSTKGQFQGWNASAVVPLGHSTGPFKVYVLEESIGFSGNNIEYTVVSVEVQLTT